MACIITDNKILADEIKNYMKGQCAKYKIPRYIEFVENFPTNANGKVMRKKIKTKI